MRSKQFVRYRFGGEGAAVPESMSESWYALFSFDLFRDLMNLPSDPRRQVPLLPDPPFAKSNISLLMCFMWSFNIRGRDRVVLPHFAICDFNGLSTFHV